MWRGRVSQRTRRRADRRNHLPELFRGYGVNPLRQDRPVVTSLLVTKTQNCVTPPARKDLGYFQGAVRDCSRFVVIAARRDRVIGTTPEHQR